MSIPRFYPMLIFAMDAVATSLDTEYEADALEEAWKMYEQFAEWHRQAVSAE